MSALHWDTSDISCFTYRENLWTIISEPQQQQQQQEQQHQQQQQEQQQQQQQQQQQAHGAVKVFLVKNISKT